MLTAEPLASRVRRLEAQCGGCLWAELLRDLARCGSVTRANDELNLTLTYRGGDQDIVVPRRIRVRTTEVGGPAMLVPGAHGHRIKRNESARVPCRRANQRRQGQLFFHRFKASRWDLVGPCAAAVPTPQRSRTRQRSIDPWRLDALLNGRGRRRRPCLEAVPSTREASGYCPHHPRSRGPARQARWRGRTMSRRRSSYRLS